MDTTAQKGMSTQIITNDSTIALDISTVSIA